MSDNDNDNMSLEDALKAIADVEGIENPVLEIETGEDEPPSVEVKKAIHPFLFLCEWAGHGDNQYEDSRLVKLIQKINREPLPGEFVVIASCMRVGEKVYYWYCNDVSIPWPRMRADERWD